MSHSKSRGSSENEAVPATDADGTPAASAPLIPVVGIGASAGGLDALELFLRAVPLASSAAYVIVQHLDPTQKGMLVELLQRVSPLPVLQVTEGVVVEPRHVYVIPPNTDMAMERGALHLLVPAEPRGLRLPIDFFFRSLAEDIGPRAVGVVLSGMGSDGTLGLRAIRAAAGGVFVQAPSSAKFSGMPESAIAADVADAVASPAELPGKIHEYLQRGPALGRPDRPQLDTKSMVALEQIVGLLRGATGQDFSAYKPSTIYRRIERRMGLHQIADISQYVRYVRENVAEAKLLFGELLIGVTSFFRDPAAWERLSSDVLPALFGGAQKGARIRVWVPACSTGEEAYSLAIAFKEAAEKYEPTRGLSLQIFATDLDAVSIQKARRGLYPEAVAGDLGEERFSRFFVKEGREVRVRREIRDLVVFATQNILQDPPFTKLDLLSCRNLLIYLDAEAQRKLVPLFHYSLKPGGALFLGSAETVGAYTDLFAPIDGKSRLYRRLGVGLGDAATLDRSSGVPIALPADASSPAPSSRPDAAPPTNLRAQVEAVLLQRFTPAAVLASSKGDVLFVSGRTGKYLELPTGNANWNILGMAREGLRHALSRGFHKAIRTGVIVTLPGLLVGEGGGRCVVDVTLEPLFEPPALRGSVMIVFADVKSLRSDSPLSANVGDGVLGSGEGASRPEKELQQARDDLRIVSEEAQTKEEELKSANEELQSTNEELQSTNEELTTSKEEMQSMNEELQTLNTELSAKVADLSRSSNDMKNLLDSTEIAVLFLDDAMNVRRFTPEAAQVIKLIPGDVGRPLADLATDLEYPELYDDARAVLKTLIFKEKGVGSRSGRRFRVRIMPYRTFDNHIDGLVITFTKVPEASVP